MSILKTVEWIYIFDGLSPYQRWWYSQMWSSVIDPKSKLGQRWPTFARSVIQVTWCFILSLPQESLSSENGSLFKLTFEIWETKIFAAFIGISLKFYQHTFRQWFSDFQSVINQNQLIERRQDTVILWFNRKILPIMKCIVLIDLVY